MAGKLKLDQIPFGTLNNISDAGGPSTDRRRTDPLEFLRLSTEEAYSRNALRNKDSFEGIIVSKKLITYPSVRNKSALFREFVLKEAQNKEEAAVGDPDETDDYPTFVYKVYIPEIEPRPIPRGTDDPILATYADVHSDVNNVENGLPIGTLVRVIYEDVGSLYGPRISAVVGPPVQLAGYEKSQGLRKRFNSKKAIPLRDAIPSRKLSTKEIELYSARRADFTGDTPNADKLRAELTRLGYKELSNGGDITEVMASVGIQVFKKIKELVPNVEIVVTGGNDKYHQVIKSAGMYSSRHTFGLALDFVFGGVVDRKAAKAAILKILQGFSASNGPFRLVDEYSNLSASANGPHFDFSYKEGTQGKEAQKEAKKLLKEGRIEGYQLDGIT